MPGHFSKEHDLRVKPILTERTARCITAHRANYNHIATFTDRRYGESMAEAPALAEVDSPVFLIEDGL